MRRLSGALYAPGIPATLCPITGQPDFASIFAAGLCSGQDNRQITSASSSISPASATPPAFMKTPRSKIAKRVVQATMHSRNSCASPASGIRAVVSLSTCSGRPAICRNPRHLLPDPGGSRPIAAAGIGISSRYRRCREFSSPGAYSTWLAWIRLNPEATNSSLSLGATPAAGEFDAFRQHGISQVYCQHRGNRLPRPGPARW